MSAPSKIRKPSTCSLCGPFSDHTSRGHEKALGMMASCNVIDIVPHARNNIVKRIAGYYKLDSAMVDSCLSQVHGKNLKSEILKKKLDSLKFLSNLVFRKISVSPIFFFFFKISDSNLTTAISPGEMNQPLQDWTPTMTGTHSITSCN